MKKLNVAASYVSQLYSGLIGIVVLPLYINFMGIEAFGLVGVFIMLQALANLLDMGLTPTAARETARFNGGSKSLSQYRSLMVALERVFFVIAIIIAVVIGIASDFLGTKWLRGSELSLDEIIFSVVVMGCIVALRWLGGLYRGVITGNERFVWLGTFNVAIATIRFVLVLPFLIYVGSSPTYFFGYQLFAAIVEITVIAVMAYKVMPSLKTKDSWFYSWTSLKPVLMFSSSIGFTTVIWIIVTQLDKLILSSILTLAEYGQFTMAVMAASGVMLAGAPISIVLMPLMAKLHAQSNNKEMIEEYRKGTQLACVIVISVSAVMAFFVYPVLYGWTGDLNLVKNIAPIFVLYTMGNTMLVLSAFPYYLQYAIGNLRLHVLGNIAFVIILVPSVIWAARSYGGMGAASVWFVTNSLFFLLWVPFVHSRLAPGLNYRWYTIDIFSIIIPTVVTAYLLNLILPGTGERWLGLVIAMSSGIVVLIIGFLSASSFRTVMLRYISGWYRRYL